MGILKFNIPFINSFLKNFKELFSKKQFNIFRAASYSPRLPTEQGISTALLLIARKSAMLLQVALFLLLRSTFPLILSSMSQRVSLNMVNMTIISKASSNLPKNLLKTLRIKRLNLKVLSQIVGMPPMTFLSSSIIAS